MREAITAISGSRMPCVVTDGVPRYVGRSRNTPGSIRNVRVADCKLPRDFSGTGH